MSLDFWKKVEKTNPKYTKNVKVSGQHRTAVDAQYKKKMITEHFGMCGMGWGVVPGSENYERHHYEKSTCLLTYTATAFYVFEGTRYEMPIAAQIKESFMTSGGNGYLKIDDEAVKKVRTDALTKAFTDLGFCADIHMGMFDDQDYVHGATIAANAKEQEEREEAARLAYEEIKAWLQKETEAASTLSNPQSHDKAIDRLKAKVKMKCNAAGLASRGFTDKLENLKKEGKK